MIGVEKFIEGCQEITKSKYIPNTSSLRFASCKIKYSTLILIITLQRVILLCQSLFWGGGGNEIPLMLLQPISTTLLYFKYAYLLNQ